MKIAIITDIHENVQMLEKALRMAEQQGCDEVACLGDIVGYDHRFHQYPALRSATRCLELVRKSCRWVVAGNHDLFAAHLLPSFTNGFSFPPDWFERDANERKQLAMGKVWPFEGELPNDMRTSDIEYIASLPEHHRMVEANAAILFSHYLYPDFTGSTTQYIERHRQLHGLWQFMEAEQLTFAFCGHAHTPFAAFAYPRKRSLLKAIHPIPNHEIRLGMDRVAVLLPPLSGDKGKAGFSIFDTTTRQLNIIYTV